MTATSHPVQPTDQPVTAPPTLTGEPGSDRAEQTASAPVFTRTNMAIHVFGGLTSLGEPQDAASAGSDDPTGDSEES